MISLSLYPRTANGVKITNKAKQEYKCLNGHAHELATVLESKVLCGARDKIEFEEMKEHLYDPEIGGRTLLELPTVLVKNPRTGEMQEKRVALHEQFAR